MLYKTTISASAEAVGSAMEFIETALVGSDRQAALKGMSAAEDVLLQLIDHAESPEAPLKISVQRKKHSARIRFACRGRAFRLSDGADRGDSGELDEEQTSVVGGLQIRSRTETVSLSCGRGLNRAELVIREKPSDAPNPVLTSMGMGAVFGLLLRILAPAAFSDGLSLNVFGPVSDVFFNLIRMVMTPMVFFSVAESVSGFSDYRAFGRIGGKVIGTYLTTSAVALVIGVVVFLLLPVGDPAERAAVLAVSGTSATAAATDTSLLQTLIGIVPSNAAGAFLSDNMLQIIFLAVVCGIAAGKTGEYVASMQLFFHTGSRFFGSIADMVMKTLPAAVFCIMANTLLVLDVSSALSLAKLFGVILLSLVLMQAAFSLTLRVLCRRDPRIFYRKFRRAMITAFTTASGSATSPVTKDCLKDMGVSPKVYSFSVPLGTVINSTDIDILLPVTTMFMMRIFGVPIDLTVLPALLLSGYLLAFTAPGVPGSAYAAHAMLLAQFGMPAGAVGYMIPVLTLVDFICTVNNVTGHAVAAVFVANSEGLLEEEKYVGL